MICGHTKSRVLYSKDGRRRRECTACSFRWTSIEMPVEKYQRLLALHRAVAGLKPFQP